MPILEHCHRESCKLLVDGLQAEIARLREELARECQQKEAFEQVMLEVRKALCGDINNQDDILDLIATVQTDAVRYRWLRDKNASLGADCWIVRDQNSWVINLDAAIDAAMKEGEQA